MAVSSDTGTSRRSRAGAVVLLGVVVLSYTTLENMLAPALPLMQQALGASPAEIAWVFTGLLLAGTVSVPLIGRLADVHDPRRVLLVVLAIVAAGVALAAAASSIVVLAIGQVLQGAGLGFVPLCMVMLRNLRSGASMASSVGLIMGAGGLGTIFGGLLAGPILAVLPYQFLYWIPLGVLVLCWALVLVLLPAMSPQAESAHGRIDWLGAGLLAGGLLALLLGVTLIASLGWGVPVVLGLIVAAVVLLGAFAVVELRTTDPLVDLRVGGRRMTVIYAVGFASGWAAASTMVTLPMIVAGPAETGYGLGEPPLTTGLLYMVVGTVSAGSSFLVGPLERLVGAKPLLVLSCLPILVAPVVPLVAGPGLVQLVIVSAAVGIGSGLGFTQAMNLVMAAVPAARVGSATGATGVVRAVAATLGAQVTGSILTLTVLPGQQQPAWGGFVIVFATGIVIAGGAVLLSFLFPAIDRGQRGESTVLVTP